MIHKYLLHFACIFFLLQSFTLQLFAQDEWHEITKALPVPHPYDINDDFGYSIGMDGDYMVVGVPEYQGMSEFVTAGAVFVYRNINEEWQLKGMITTYSKVTGNKFGHAVAISGDYIVVGAYAENENKGAVYVYTKPENGWTDMTETAILTASDGAINDQFGYSVSVSGTSIVVGAYLDDDNGGNSGSAYIFEKPENGWDDMTETGKLTPSDGASNDYFGRAVAMSGNTVIIGSLYDDDNGDLSGSGYVYEKPESGWQTMTESAKLTASDGSSGDFLSRSATIEGDVIVLGADGVNSKTGAVYIYQKSGDHWSNMTETAKLTGSDGAADNHFGTSVAISNDQIAVAAFNDDVNGDLSGKAYVFQKPESGWTNDTEDGNLTASDAQSEDYYGRAIGVSGDFVMVGGKQFVTPKGRVYEFKKASENWISSTEEQQIVSPIFSFNANDNFGRNVAIDANTAVIGSRTSSVNVYEKYNDSWIKVAELTALEGSDSDYFGWEVAISGNVIIVSAYNAPGENGSTDGRVYVYEKPENGWHDMTETAVLTPSPEVHNHHLEAFGYAIAISQNTIVVGERSSPNNSSDKYAYVFEKPETGWQNMYETAKLYISGYSSYTYEHFGYAVAISGDVIITSVEDGGIHKVALFEKPIEGWEDISQTALLTPSTIPFGDFGDELSISGDVVVVGQLHFGGTSSIDDATAFVYEKPETGWHDMTETARLIPSDFCYWPECSGSTEFYFGGPVFISGNTIVVGAYNRNIWPADDFITPLSGAVYVFKKPSDGWVDTTEHEIILASDTYTEDKFGVSVGVSGSNIIVGALNNSNGHEAGTAYFYTDNFSPSLISGAIEDQTFNEDEVDYTINDLNTYFEDPESEPLTYTATSSNADILVSVTGSELSLSATEHYYGNGEISVIVSDGSNTLTTSFQVNINPVNDDPTDISLSPQSILENQEIGTLIGSFSTSEVDPEDTSHTYTLVGGEGAEDNTSFTIENEQLLSNEVFNYDNQNTFNIRIKTEDGNGGSFEKAFVITIEDLNKAPVFAKGEDQVILEDAGSQIVNNWATNISDGDNGGQQVTFNVSNNNNSLFSTQPTIDNNGNLSYTPALNKNGIATVTVSLSDDGGTENGGEDTSDDQTFTITVTAVNDAPSFSVIGNQTFQEDVGTQSIANFATVVNFGPEDEDNQAVLTYHISNDNNSLFSVQPNLDNEGTLSFTPASDVFGSTIVTVSLQDNGGTENGGVDTSEVLSFTITINAVNDAPSFSMMGDQSIIEDAGDQTIEYFAHAISVGPENENDQTVLSFNLSNNNNSLFSAQPTIDNNGNLSYTPALNKNGIATVTVSLSDDGGTENGGVDTSEEQTFTITVTAVNDAPSFSVIGNQTIQEDVGTQSIANFATVVNFGPEDEDNQAVLTYHISNDNNSLFSVQPNLDNEGTLSFTPASDVYGSTTVTVSLQDNGGTENGGVDTSEALSFTISITAVNDAPSFSMLGDQIIIEDAGVQTIANFAHAIVLGPENENDQTVLSFNLSNNNNSLFSTQPTIDNNGNLSYTPALNKNGIATVTVGLSDDGGTENGGIDTSEDQTFTITVTPVNDSPELNEVTVLTATEDIEYTYQMLVTDPDDENNGTDLNWVLNNQPEGMSISSTGLISWTPTEGILSSGEVLVTVADGGEDAALAAVQAFTIAVTPVNDSPELTEVTVLTAKEDIKYTYQMLVTDPDDENNGVELSWDLGNKPNGMSISNTGLISWTPTEGVLTSGEVTVSVVDGGEDNASIGSQAFTITVTPVNDAPVIITDASDVATEDILFNQQIEVSDPDDENNGTDLVWSLENEPDGMSISNTGLISWIPANGIFDSGEVTVTVSDGGEDEAQPNSKIFYFTVNAINDAPELGNIENMNLCPAATEVIDLRAITSDVDDPIENITFSVSSNPNIAGLELLVDQDDDLLILTNNTEQINETVTIEVVATDTTGDDAIQTFELNLLYMEVSILQDGNQLTATAGNTYQWFRDGIVISESAGGTLQTIQASEVGNYSVAVGYENNCVGISEEVFIDNLTNLNLNDLSSQISVYPNPVIDFIHLQKNDELKEISKIQLFDIHGKLVLDQDEMGEKIDVSNLPKGVYLLQMVVGEKGFARKRVVKN